jgi:hypothetical protein
MLDLINNDDATQALKCGHGLGQECATRGVLQIKVVAGAVWHYLARQSGLPALPGSDQSDYAASPEGTPQAVKQSGTFQHRANVP